MAQAPNNFRQNLSIITPLAVITLSLSSSVISNGINIYKSGADTTLDDKQSSTVFAMLGSVFLSIFIILGLYGSNRQSHILRNKISVINASQLRTAESSFGSTARSDLQGAIGLLLSLASIAVNVTEGAQTVFANFNGNTRAITMQWLIAVQFISVIANLYGFISMDRLGARNGKLLEFLHKLELHQKDNSIDNLNIKLREKQNLLRGALHTLTDAGNTFRDINNALIDMQNALTFAQNTLHQIVNQPSVMEPA